jgi:hypothetical protein
MDKTSRLAFFENLQSAWHEPFSYTNTPDKWQILDVTNIRGHHTHYEWRFEGGANATRLGVEFHMEKMDPNYIERKIAEISHTFKAELEAKTGSTVFVQPSWKPGSKMDYGRIFIQTNKLFDKKALLDWALVNMRHFRETIDSTVRDI